MRRLAAGVVLLLAATALAPAGVSVASGGPPPAAEPASVPGELLVGYRHGVSESHKSEARGRANAERVDRVVDESGGRAAVELVSFKGIDRAEATRRFKSNPNVAFAEPNWVYTHDATSNDPYYTNGSLWGMSGDASVPANQFGSQAAEAWANGNTGQSSVYVGIIDEGYQYTHPDLALNAGKNPGESATLADETDGVDDDGNGYKDDVYGWDFAGNNKSVYDGTADDHGTHVAGTIGAEGGNGQGVAGVAWNVKLLSAKFLGASGGTTANAVKAVDYFTDLKARHGLNLVATNNSWGGGGYSQALFGAISRANAANILFVAAAGNDYSNNDVTASYPSGYDLPNIISVAAINKLGAKPSFSNYGAVSVDLGAPGEGIWSTLPTNSYGSYSGTSMATPHVTGAVALYAANHSASAAAIKSAILGSVVFTPALDGITLTEGRLNVSTFGTGTPPVPGPPSAPLGLTATGADSQVVLAWQPPADDGGSAISYKIYRNDGAIHSGETGLTYTDSTVANGTTYTYAVAAVNAIDEGARSNTASATPVALSVTATKGQKRGPNTLITVTWTGFAGTSVDFFKNSTQTATANDGIFTENLKGTATVTYKVCETNTSICAQDTLTF